MADRFTRKQLDEAFAYVSALTENVDMGIAHSEVQEVAGQFAANVIRGMPDRIMRISTMLLSEDRDPSEAHDATQTAQVAAAVIFGMQLRDRLERVPDVPDAPEGHETLALYDAAHAERAPEFDNNEIEGELHRHVILRMGKQLSEDATLRGPAFVVCLDCLMPTLEEAREL